MGSQWWEDAPLTVNVFYVAPQMPTKLPTNQLPKVSFAEDERPREGGCFAGCKQVQGISANAFSVGLFCSMSRFTVYSLGVARVLRMPP